MRKILMMMAACLIIMPVLGANTVSSEDKAVIALVTKLIKMSSEKEIFDVVRYFQFTSTSEKNNNRYEIVFDEDYNNAGTEEVLNDMGLKNADRGKYLFSLKDRSSARLKRLWGKNHSMIIQLMKTLPNSSVILKYADWLVSFHDAESYASAIAKLKAKSPVLDESTSEIAEMIVYESDMRDLRSLDCSGSYCQSDVALAFWYRRIAEKNDAVVYMILKDVQSSLSQMKKNDAAAEECEE